MTGGEARVSWLRYDKTRTLRNVDTFALTPSIQVEASMRIVKRLNLRIDVACLLGRIHWAAKRHLMQYPQENSHEDRNDEDAPMCAARCMLHKRESLLTMIKTSFQFLEAPRSSNRATRRSPELPDWYSFIA